MQMLFPLQPRNRGLSSRTNATDCGIGAGSVHTRCIAHSPAAAPQRYQNATLTTGTLNRSNYLSGIARDHGRQPRTKSAVATALTPKSTYDWAWLVARLCLCGRLVGRLRLRGWRSGGLRGGGCRALGWHSVLTRVVGRQDLVHLDHILGIEVFHSPVHIVDRQPDRLVV